ncbi:MAG: SIR2 family protein [Cyclobacteriaceae bacterium]
MKKKKVVYLFGAGAAIPWDGPKTSDLTSAILNSGFYCKDGKTRVTQKVFDVLSLSFDESEINFETIMSVLEELIVIHSSDNHFATNSFLFPFVQKKGSLDDLYNFEVTVEVKHGFTLKIPSHELESGKHAYQNQSPKQLYLQLLYANLLTTISAKVSSYSYHTSGNSKIISDSKEALNDNFYRWISSKVKMDYFVRLYSLNYDRLFSVILKKNKIDIFEGAECGSEIKPGENINFDLNRILTDFESNCHYNLHGSSFWEIKARNNNQLPAVQYTLTGAPNLPCNLWEQPLIQMEKGKTINPSNIITGYQKAQKSSISPFRQIQSAFDRDCIESNMMYIVGYSFGDAHINESIKNLLISSPETQITIIDPNFRENKTDEKIALELLSNSALSLSPTNLTEKSCSFLDGKIIVREDYFDKYLENTTQ